VPTLTAIFKTLNLRNQNTNNVVPEPHVLSPFGLFTSPQETNTITKICHNFKWLKQEFFETISIFCYSSSAKKSLSLKIHSHSFGGVRLADAC
jgi:hypothetical protein